MYKYDATGGPMTHYGKPKLCDMRRSRLYSFQLRVMARQSFATWRNVVTDPSLVEEPVLLKSCCSPCRRICIVYIMYISATMGECAKESPEGRLVTTKSEEKGHLRTAPLPKT